jgi:lipid-A-disaccharide synthase
MKPLRVGIVAGEMSGDLLGAGLIRALHTLRPEIIFEGIAGPKMIEAGCQVMYPVDRLAVMGFIEPLKRLPELLRIRRHLVRHLIQNPPDVFIGIDAPDFNLGIELRLKKAGIKTVHYVSPSVWAWRKNRIHTIKRAVDLMLLVFPFELDFYRMHNMPAQFIGHPLADEIPETPHREEARAQLQLAPQKKILAILPGSRAMEIRQMAEPFIRTARACLTALPDLQIVTAMASPARREEFSKILNRVDPYLPIQYFDGQSQRVMEAADALLLTSGTVTLEAMLLKRPMVVAYRMPRLLFYIMKRLVKLPYFSLPNLIAGKSIVPEFLQGDVTPENMGKLLLFYLQEGQSVRELEGTFLTMHRALKLRASVKAAEAILALLPKGNFKF